MTDKRFKRLKKPHHKGQPPRTGVPLAEWEEFTARGGLGRTRPPLDVMAWTDDGDEGAF